MTSVEGEKEQNGARGKRVKGRIKTSQKRKKQCHTHHSLQPPQCTLSQSPERKRAILNSSNHPELVRSNLFQTSKALKKTKSNQKKNTKTISFIFVQYQIEDINEKEKAIAFQNRRAITHVEVQLGLADRHFH